MMRSFAVVLVFMGLNALGFVAYRGRATPDPAGSSRRGSDAGAAATFSRAQPASQPKPVAPEKPAVVTAPTSAPDDHAFTHVPESTVTEHTNASATDRLTDGAGDEAGDEASAPVAAHHVHHRGPARRRIEPSAPAAKPAHEVARTVEAKPSEPEHIAKDKPHDRAKAHDTAQDKARDKARDQDKLLEMEANPYKQRE
jgi:hypothetical protein